MNVKRIGEKSFLKLKTLLRSPTARNPETAAEDPEIHRRSNT